VNGRDKGGRERIIQATVTLLLEMGLLAVQTRAVTERAGVGTGLLNHHFRWPELRAKAWEAIFEEVVSDLWHVGEDPAVALDRFAAESFDSAARPYWTLWIQAEALSATDKAMEAALARTRTALRHRFTALLEAGNAAGCWSLPRPGATAVRLEALRDGLTGLLLNGDPDIDAAQASQHLRHAIMLECRLPADSK
jgi:AcrR family transcriptional regulator